MERNRDRWRYRETDRDIEIDRDRERQNHTKTERTEFLPQSFEDVQEATLSEEEAGCSPDTKSASALVLGFSTSGNTRNTLCHL